jgi:hypothetical protein
MRTTHNYDGMARLVDYVVQAAGRHEHLTEYEAPEATVKRMARGDGHLVVEDQAQARVSVLLAAALEQMREDMFPAEVDEERRSRNVPLTKDRAVVLVRQHGSVRAAALAQGCSHVTLLRVLGRVK